MLKRVVGRRIKRSKQFDFRKWYQKWWDSHANDDESPTLYESMLDAFIMGREVGLLDNEDAIKELEELKRSIEKFFSVWLKED